MAISKMANQNVLPLISRITGLELSWRERLKMRMTKCEIEIVCERTIKRPPVIVEEPYWK